MAPGILLTLDRLRRAVDARRRLLAAGFAAAAVIAGLQVVAPPEPATTTVTVAARDLTAGRVVVPRDLMTAALPEEHVPRGTFRQLDDVVGRVLAAPVRSGEPVTDVRLVGRSLVAGYGADRVAAPVRIADAAAVALLRTGDRVDVLAADPRGSADPVIVAAAAPVVTVPHSDDLGAHEGSGALVVLAVTPDTAKDLAKVAVAGPLSVVIRR